MSTSKNQLPSDATRIMRLKGSKNPKEMTGAPLRRLRVAANLVAEFLELLKFKYPWAAQRLKMYEPQQKPLRGTSQESSAGRRYFGCPMCGCYHHDDEFDVIKTMTCNGCGNPFREGRAINVRLTPELVEERGFLRRLFQGSSIQLSRKDALEKAIANCEQAASGLTFWLSGIASR